MKSLFNQNDSKEIIQRINQLKPDSKAEWGKMNVAQMLHHLQSPLKVAFGEMILKRGLMGILFGNMMRKNMAGSDEPFKKDLPTSAQFIVKDNYDFAIEKKKIISMIEHFSAKGESSIVNKKHPFFGTMTAHEWDTLQWKHLDHHLRQFGA